MDERKQAIWDELVAARAHLNTILDTVDDAWELQVYSEGAAWNIRQLLTHLMVSDQAQSAMVMNIAQGNGGVPDDFDLERYNRRSVEKRADVTVDAARASLVESRTALRTWFENVDLASLDKQGRHGSMRIMSVEEILRLMAAHERAHANDIAHALEAQR